LPTFDRAHAEQLAGIAPDPMEVVHEQQKKQELANKAAFGVCKDDRVVVLPNTKAFRHAFTLVEDHYESGFASRCGQRGKGALLLTTNQLRVLSGGARTGRPWMQRGSGA
jgi:hypothetical protein